MAEMIRKTLLILTMLTLAGCTGDQAANQSDPNKQRIAAKNRQTAAINEATLITQTAQRLEKEGRAMDTYRSLAKSGGAEQCQSVMLDEQKQVQDLADRITKLPTEYQSALIPITGDLNECVSCAKTAAESCVKVRMTINGAIKQLFP